MEEVKHILMNVLSSEEEEASSCSHHPDLHTQCKLIRRCWNLLLIAQPPQLPQQQQQQQASQPSNTQPQGASPVQPASQQQASHQNDDDAPPVYGSPPNMRYLLWGAVIERQYLLALDLLLHVHEDHHWARTTADQLLWQLGMRWRLADPVWDRCQQKNSKTEVLTYTSDHLSTLIADDTTAGTGTHTTTTIAVTTRTTTSTTCTTSLKTNGIITAGTDCNTHTTTTTTATCQVAAGSAAGGGASEGRNRQATHVDATGPPPTTIPPSPSKHHKVIVFEPGDALPSTTLAALQCAFAPDSPFWSDHTYGDPDTPFFSYIYDVTHLPQSIVEVAAQQLRSHPFLASHLASVTHVEWWAHSRSVSPYGGGPRSKGHQLHYDCDERHLRQGHTLYHLRHPLYSSVLYLSSPPGCGPTLVLDQTPHDTQLAGQAWLVNPQEGRYMVFQGNLLHGVLPAGRPDIGSSAAHERREGNTLLNGSANGGAGVWLQGFSAAAEPARLDIPGAAGTSTNTAAGGDALLAGGDDAGVPPSDLFRTTIMFAWWVNDDTSAVTAPGQDSLSLDTPGSATSSHALRPWMVAPSPQPRHITHLTPALSPEIPRDTKRAKRDDEQHPQAEGTAAQSCGSDTGQQDAQAWVEIFHGLGLALLAPAVAGQPLTTGSAPWLPQPVSPAWCPVSPAVTRPGAPPHEVQQSITQSVVVPDNDDTHKKNHEDGDNGHEDRDHEDHEDHPIDVTKRVTHGGLPVDVEDTVLHMALPDLRFFLSDQDVFNHLYPT